MQLQALLAWHQSWCGDFPYNETYPTAECANKAKERLKKLTEAQTNLIFFFFKQWSVYYEYVSRNRS